MVLVVEFEGVGFDEAFGAEEDFVDFEEGQVLPFDELRDLASDVCQAEEDIEEIFVFEHLFAVSFAVDGVFESVVVVPGV